MSGAIVPIRLGPLHVTTDPPAVAAFASSLRSDGAVASPAAKVPHTFPISWLSLPPVQAAIRACYAPDALLVQAFQAFRYSRRLEVGEAYEMLATLERSRSSTALRIDASVRAADQPVVEMQVELLEIDRFAAAVRR